MISGPVKLKLFCLKKELPGLANSLISLPLPQIGQNGQNTGEKNRIVMRPIHAIAVQPTTL